MIPLESTVEGKQLELSVMEEELRNLGFSYGGNWEWDHGYFDYKIDDEDGYLFLRVPIEAVKMQLDQDGAVVKIGQPFLLAHIYQEGLDDHVHTWQWTGSIDQFSEPVDKDADIDDKWLDVGEKHLKRMEDALSPYF
ncbi:YugN-like family protein [Pseudalkalibacillus caeni]|uniref:YugN-like family protein n=1 Tax=Exobacillus caeni TaxID=2574798 RepID=A0A5R9F8N7_9BACL|nr:YugN-like family protein [Pseudalkalibacillus caeni]TLS38889.1 hypothetical protein FCL54_00820 [Pseudalkalibacillus caeni]